MRYTVFVDGQAGTTGLKIYERLAIRDDLEILGIAPEYRKDLQARGKLINQADVVFLCLPDTAARESIRLIRNEATRVVDASTAHRTHPAWDYGLPELSSDHRERIARSRRVSVPGCHATGFALAVYPLVQTGILPPDYPVTCYSLTGYSGGGKQLIGRYEGAHHDLALLAAPRPYSLGLTHKHLPEMKHHNSLQYAPLFVPVVANFYQGMGVSVPLHQRLLAQKVSARDVHAQLTSYYASQYFVDVMPYGSEELFSDGFLDITACNSTNRAELFVFGHDHQIVVFVRLDNLGKGASGAAIQNMNIMLGLDEQLGLGPGATTINS